MQISRRDACRVGGGLLALGPASSLARAAASDLTIVSADLPAEIEQGGTFSAAVELENVGDTEVTTEVSYRFEDDLIASMDVSLEPGGRRTFTLPDMKYAWLEQDSGELDPGTYTHSIGATGGPRRSAEVEIVAGDGTPTGTPTGETPPRGLREVSTVLPEELRRGETAIASITVENTRSEPITIEVTYAFEGMQVFAKNDITIEPGEARKIEFPDVSLSAIEDAAGGEERIPPGTYTHSLGIPGGPRVTREVEVVGTSTASGGGAQLRIESVELPDEIRKGESFTVSMTVENRGEGPADATPTYAFDGERVLSGSPSEGLPIAAGSSEQFRYGGIELGMIEESLGGPVEPGNHKHSIGFPEGPREVSGVRVVTGSDSAPAAEPSAESGEGRQRGFFSNSGNEPAFLSNPFNLTTLGFLLSVAGIAHQLFQGR